MKAIGITKIGGPEVLGIVDVPDPAYEAGQVLVEVEATAYNHVDALLRSEDFGLKFPVIPGSDVVGRVVDGSPALAGRRVVINPSLPCKYCDHCLTGHHCRFVQILGVHRQGGYGQYIVVDQKQCYVVPNDLMPETLAAFPLTFLTAWRMLKSRAQLQGGEKVLVWGASGGLGSAAVAVSKALSATVIAVVRQSDHVSKIIDYGADTVIDLSGGHDVVEAVMDFTKGCGVEVVFEGPGTPTWRTSIAATAPWGRIVTAGVTAGSKVELDIEDLYYRQISVIGSRMGYAEEFKEVLEYLLNKQLAPLVAEVLPVSKAAQAHRLAMAGDRCGKIVLRHDL